MSRTLAAAKGTVGRDGWARSTAREQSWGRMLGVRVLREDDELARVVGPVAEGVEVEGRPKRGRRRQRFQPRQRITVPHAPPTLHVDLRLVSRVARNGGPYTLRARGQWGMTEA